MKEDNENLKSEVEKLKNELEILKKINEEKQAKQVETPQIEYQLPEKQETPARKPLKIPEKTLSTTQKSLKISDKNLLQILENELFLQERESIKKFCFSLTQKQNQKDKM